MPFEEKEVSYWRERKLRQLADQHYRQRQLILPMMPRLTGRLHSYDHINVMGLLFLWIPILISSGFGADLKAGTSKEEPVSEYQHAPPSAVDAFNDLKYGIRIHWGIYTTARTSASKGGESWMFLPLGYSEKQAYQEMYKKWNPTGFDADEWVNLFADNGMKMFAITTKHHEGFSLFDTKTHVKKRVNWIAPGGPTLEDCDLAYSVMDTPFHRDIIRELCEAGHRRGLAIDLYFSHPDWYDADFRPYGCDPVYFPDAANHRELYGKLVVDKKLVGESTKTKFNIFNNAPAPTQEEENRMMARHRDQLTELLTNYGKIDMVCLDIQLGDKVWKQLRETMLALRKIQPDVMFRNRGIGAYGDYETPERVIPGDSKRSNLPWFVIYPLAKDFDYDPDPKHYKGGEWIIRSLVDCVAKGGNFMVGVGPGPDGRFHPTAIENIRSAGAWLKVNGEGIYSTRARGGESWREGDEIRYTRSKDHHTIYAFSLHWPGKSLVLKTVEPKANSPIYLLGYPKPLNWTYSAGSGTTVQLPDDLLNSSSQKNFFVSGFKIQPKT